MPPLRSAFLLLGAAVAARALGSNVPEPPPPPPAARAEITEELQRVLGYLDQAMPSRMAGSQADRGEQQAFDPLAYETGVIHVGMLAAADVTREPGFTQFVVRHLRLIGDHPGAFRSVVSPASLDDCGAMAAALIEARRKGVGPDLLPVIERWTGYIAHRQFRLPDGTPARHRPQPVTVWADDLYMAVPATVSMGRLTGDPTWYHDAVRMAQGMTKRLFRPDAGLFAHGWMEDNPSAANLYWGRANGWAVLALETLLDQLPANEPGRGEILALLRRHLHALTELQSGHGLWHQVLDRNDSYEETSCSAMFVYAIAHAIDQGWISPVGNGCIAEAGWRAVARQINSRGQVENTCVGTTLGSDPEFYYRRPVSPYATHGYGPVLLAGAEMIRLSENPAFAIVNLNGTYHFVPR